eukprot:scaffold721_cov131-Cylindrotheca_fusiformis.AAC.64
MDIMSESNEDERTLTSQKENGGQLSENIQGSNAEKVMESVVRISFAGLVGSIIGLGQKGRLESMRVLTGAAATAAARRKRSAAPQTNLPLTMALSCMMFCTVLETSRLTSPSTLLLNSRGLAAPTGEADKLQSATITVADFTFGGAMAGIASSFGKTSQKRLPIAAFRASGRFFGLLPGILLGFAAGSIQAAADYGIDYFETVSDTQNDKSSN